MVAQKRINSNFTYAPDGNRVSKLTNNGNTYYVRVASGNIMATKIPPPATGGVLPVRMDKSIYPGGPLNKGRVQNECLTLTP